VILIALGLVFLYRANVGEEAAGFLDRIVADPEMQLPPSVLDRDGGAGSSDAATRPDAAPAPSGR
jgi:hypothetical protein